MKYFLTAFFALFLSTSAQALNLRSDCGAVGDGLADDTAAFNTCLAGGAFYAPRGDYRITSQPVMPATAISITGDGIDTTNFIRDFNGTLGLGLITLANGSRGSLLKNFSIHSAANRTGGHGIAIVSPANYTAGNVLVSGVKISAYTNNAWFTTFRVDGSARTTEPRGVRTVTLSDVHLFGAETFSLDLRTAIAFSWHGGGAYIGGGTGRYSGGLLMAGTSAYPTQFARISVTQIGVVTLQSALNVAIDAPVLGIGSGAVIEAQPGVGFVSIRGQPYPGAGVTNGGVAAAWYYSSLTTPNLEIYR